MNIKVNLNPNKEDKKGLLDYKIYDNTNNQKILSFKDLFGFVKEKAILLEFKDVIQDHKKAKELGLTAPTGVLLHGEPGTGKTVLGQGLAKETNLPLIFITGSSFSSKFKGEGTNKVKELFAKARELAPCIVLIDECEVALADLEKYADSDVGVSDIVNEFKNQLENLENNDDKPIFFIGATNHIDRVDSAIKSRIGTLLEVKPFDTEARLKFLQHLCDKRFKKTDRKAKLFLPILNEALEPYHDLHSSRACIKLLEKAALLALNANSSDIKEEHLEKALLFFVDEDLLKTARKHYNFNFVHNNCDESAKTLWNEALLDSVLGKDENKQEQFIKELKDILDRQIEKKDLTSLDVDRVLKNVLTAEEIVDFENIKVDKRKKTNVKKYFPILVVLIETGQKVDIKYDDKGNLKTSELFDLNGEKLGNITYSYDEKGKIKTSEIFKPNGEKWGSIIYSYDDKGNLKTSEIFRVNGEKWVNIIYSYDDKGNLKTSEMFKPNGEQLENIIYSYDDKGNLKAGETFKPKGEKLKNITYSYDEKGNLQTIKYEE